MLINFIEETHEYFNGDKKLISVTQLMQKHGLSPDYSNVNKEVLNRKAERGSLVHKEIELFIKGKEIGFTSEMLNFKNYIEANKVDTLKSEFIVYNDVVAGTVDLLLYQNDKFIIADIKTTATLHKEAVSWQLSIYAYLSNMQIDKGQAFHFDKDGNLKVVDIELKPVEEVIKLLECERQGTIYKQELASVDNTQIAKLIEAETLIANIEAQKKAAEENAKSLREALFNEMQQRGLTTFETDKIKLTVKAAYTRSTIDSAALKKDMPEIVDKYTKTSNVKASLLITLKEE